jgi:hypothetical protein
MAVKSLSAPACPLSLAARQIIVLCSDIPIGLRTPGVPPWAGIAAGAVSTSAIRSKPHGKRKRFVGFVVGAVFVFMNQPFCSCDFAIMPQLDLNQGKKLSERASLSQSSDL